MKYINVFNIEFLKKIIKEIVIKIKNGFILLEKNFIFLILKK